MTAMTAAEIAQRAHGAVDGDANAVADSWEFDSRVLRPGACFVALRDSRDGHDFVPSAFDAGATVAVVDRPVIVPAQRAAIRVPDTLQALQGVARSLRAERADLDVVAVSGSTGKTSTKDLLAAVLAPMGSHANAESFNNEFGLPLTICNAPEAARVLIAEMGERFPGDLRLLCDIAQPGIGVVTNVGLAHAEHLGGEQGVVEVLAELLEALPTDGVAVLNGDDPRTPELAARTKASVITVGEASDATFMFDDVAVDEHLRPSFSLQGHRFGVPLHGHHHARNAALAVAVAHHVYGMSFDEIAVELANATSGKWRMELLETVDGIVVLNDSYNANPTSMEAALIALSHLPVRGRRIAVLGDMRELGAYSNHAHREVGARVVALGIDLLIGVGSGGDVIASAAREAGGNAEVVADAKAAYVALDQIVAPGDGVLCKASRALGLEAVVESLLAARRQARAGGAA
jgi:UDP-N-acetylmuramoyl-tripeptide--D-alanyl-D-alanine ligase